MSENLFEWDIFRKAIEKWGRDAQTLMVYEEKTELQLAMLHYRRGKATIEQVADEVADLEIMTEQARFMFTQDNPRFEQLVEQCKARKLKRLLERVEQ